MQVHHVTRQVEYRGDVISLTEALVGFPAGGQVLLSSSTYQRVYGQLHNLKFDDRMHGQEQTAGNNAGEKGLLLHCNKKFLLCLSCGFEELLTAAA